MNFVPIEVDYMKIKAIKDEQKQQLMKEITETVVLWHRERIQEGLEREAVLFARKEQL